MRVFQSRLISYAVNHREVKSNDCCIGNESCIRKGIFKMVYCTRRTSHVVCATVWSTLRRWWFNLGFERFQGYSNKDFWKWVFRMFEGDLGTNSMVKKRRRQLIFSKVRISWRWFWAIFHQQVEKVIEFFQLWLLFEHFDSSIILYHLIFGIQKQKLVNFSHLDFSTLASHSFAWISISKRKFPAQTENLDNTLIQVTKSGRHVPKPRPYQFPRRKLARTRTTDMFARGKIRPWETSRVEFKIIRKLSTLPTATSNQNKAQLFLSTYPWMKTNKWPL